MYWKQCLVFIKYLDVINIIVKKYIQYFLYINELIKKLKLFFNILEDYKMFRFQLN